MVLGIGIDIEEIGRIKKSVDRFGKHFLNRIYTPLEQEYCLAKNNKYQHLAARFAAKEAVYKAVSAISKIQVSWQHIEISNELSGLPIAKLKGELEAFLADKDLKISMSHSREYVTCVAIISSKN